jgi:hypothetical protein
LLPFPSATFIYYHLCRDFARFVIFIVMSKMKRILEAYADLDDAYDDENEPAVQLPIVQADPKEKTKRLNFEKRVLSKSASMSKFDDDPGLSQMYRKIMGKIIEETGATAEAQDIPASIPLTCNLQQTTGDAIEAALRKIFGDNLDTRARGKGRIDVVFGGVDIEVKYSRNGFNSLATDSQALRSRTDKWYMYVKGDVGINTECINQVWLMRSDKLYRVMEEDRGVDSTAVNTSINLSLDKRKRIMALAQIKSDIKSIENDLRNAIWNKATGDSLPVSSMSLSRRVGLNRVRFDLKFETALRDTIREILRS